MGIILMQVQARLSYLNYLHMTSLKFYSKTKNFENLHQNNTVSVQIFRTRKILL